MSLEFGNVTAGGDFDGDDILDVSITTYDSSWYIYKGYGDSLASVGNLVMRPPINENTRHFDDVADTDGDGYADYLVSQWINGGLEDIIQLYRSPFLDTIVDWEYKEPHNKSHDLTGAGFIDFNCDSIPDIYLSLKSLRITQSEIAIFLGPNYGSSPDLRLYAPTSLPGRDTLRFAEYAVNLGDVTGDGWDDLGVIYHLNPIVYASSPSADTTVDYLLKQSSQRISAAGDVNGDSIGDIISGANFSRSILGSVDIYLGSRPLDTVPDTFFLKGDLPPVAQDRIGWRCAPAGDMNGDGLDDFMFSSQNFGGGEPGDVWVMTGSVDIITDVETIENPVLPTGFKLKQNYPNPFNPETTIEFSLPSRANATLIIYNTLGQRIRTLADEPLSAGAYRVVWNGTDDKHKQVASGMYYYELKVGDSFVQANKMILLK
jgi:FlgD Ig-like domain